MICYGDTLVNLNINKLIKNHFLSRSKLTISVYNHKISFGILNIDKDDNIKSFLEKPKLDNWINIGFILVSKNEFFKLSKKFKTFKSFLENLQNFKNIRAFRHKKNHITINTLNELNEAKKNIKKFKF